MTRRRAVTPAKGPIAPLPPALPEAIAFARALARRDFAAMMAGAMPDSHPKP